MHPLGADHKYMERTFFTCEQAEAVLSTDEVIRSVGNRQT